MTQVLPASGTWDWAKAKAVAGDFNGDGSADIGVLPGGSGTGVNVWMLPGSKTSPLSTRVLRNAASEQWLGPGKVRPDCR